MIKNSNKMYKVLGLIIAVARASCLPLAATTVSVPLTNNTGLSLYYTVTQSGSSSPTYNHVLLPTGSSAALNLNINANYTITVSSTSLGTVPPLTFAATNSTTLTLLFAPGEVSYELVATTSSGAGSGSSTSGTGVW